MSEIKKTRSLSGYMVFTMQERKKVEETMPTLKFADISRELGKRWKALSDAEKAKFNETGKTTVVEVKEKKPRKSKKAEEATPVPVEVATSSKKSKKSKAAAATEIPAPATTKKSKKVAKEVDPNKPKRGKNAFMYFLDEHRLPTKQELESAGQKAGITDVTKQVSVKWKALTEAQKAPYVAKSKSQ